jgi:hypothetical protein
MNVPAVSPMAKRSQDFDTLQNTLQSGNLSAAQGAFGAFLQDVQKTSGVAGQGSLFAPGTQASKDLQALGGALNSANLAGAQKAFASLKQDLQSAGQSGTAVAVIHPHHPLTAAEIANNGAPVAQTPTAQSIGNILNMRA